MQPYCIRSDLVVDWLSHNQLQFADILGNPITENNAVVSLMKERGRERYREI
jgi:hypothetical protein